MWRILVGAAVVLLDFPMLAGLQVSQIHKQLPPGGILVFMTGQREVEGLCKRLRTSLGKSGRESKPEVAGEGQPRGEVGEEGGMEDGFGEDAVEAADDAGDDEKGLTIMHTAALLGGWAHHRALCVQSS
jgi:ATP-dependent RNA helicase DHX37/DHR1